MSSISVSNRDSFEYQTDTRVVFGNGYVEQLGERAKDLGGQHVLIVTDPGIESAGIAERAQASVKNAGLTFCVFDGVEENPTTKHVGSGVAFTREQVPAVDLIVGLGGGSAMDCAKGVNFVLTNGGRMEDYWGDGKARQPMLPSIGIPTTAGTGSEAQRFALIAQEESHQKMACGDRKARFRTVILDPDLTRTAPRRVAASAGVDAIAHAVESYVTTTSNPVSRMFAREALQRLEGNFERSLSDPDDGKARREMLLGAHWAGAAIENSMLGAAHACANPLTAQCGVTHGVAVALMLPHVIRFNGAAVNGEYGELAQVLGSAASGGGGGESAVERLAERVSELRGAAGLPGRLRDLEVSEELLPDLARGAAVQKTGEFNPRPVGEAELLELYRAAF